MDLDNDTTTLEDAFAEHYSLWYLLTESDDALGAPFAPGALVEVIELLGITGFDRSGRWKKFAPKDRQAIEAVEALEWFYAQEGDDPVAFENRMSPSHALYRYGWSIDSMPPLKDIRDGMERLTAPSGMHKQLNSSLTLIGALAGMLLGVTGRAAHPEFNTKQKILDHLVDTAGENSPKGLPGIRETTAKRKINEGLEIVLRSIKG